MFIDVDELPAPIFGYYYDNKQLLAHAEYRDKNHIYVVPVYESPDIWTRTPEGHWTRTPVAETN